MNEPFSQAFGRKPQHVVEAPGRVNLIGEHTDYNDGFVLPTALPLQARIEIAARDDDLVRFVSVATSEPAPSTYDLGEERPTHTWRDYVQGTTAILREAGHRLRGFDARIASNVPMGSGLSSSAALLVGMMRALRAALSLDLDDLEIARLSQRVENRFVGAQVGIMDPMASSLAGKDAALFVDTRDLSYRRIPLPTSAMELAVIDSGIAHAHAHGGYNTRRRECEQACAALQIASLRELTPADVPRLAVLPDVLRRRARHVVTENERVLAAVAALEAGDLAALGRLFAASHASMRDDYEVSVPEVDALVELAAASPDVFGARLTGGGFGGSIVAACKPGTARRLAEGIVPAYRSRFGRKATLLVP